MIVQLLFYFEISKKRKICQFLASQKKTCPYKVFFISPLYSGQKLFSGKIMWSYSEGAIEPSSHKTITLYFLTTTCTSYFLVEKVMMQKKFRRTPISYSTFYITLFKDCFSLILLIKTFIESFAFQFLGFAIYRLIKQRVKTKFFWLLKPLILYGTIF